MKYLLLVLLVVVTSNVACAADEPLKLMRTMDGFRDAVPPPQTLSEQNGFSLQDVRGEAFLLTHLDGVARRMGVQTKGECLVLLAYLKDQDAKIRFIAAKAIEHVVHAYPDGMSLDDILKIDSDGHREMIRRFVERIESSQRAQSRAGVRARQL